MCQLSLPFSVYLLSLQEPTAVQSIGRVSTGSCILKYATSRVCEEMALPAEHSSVLTERRSCAVSHFEARPPHLGGLDGWSSGFGGGSFAVFLALDEMEDLQAILPREDLTRALHIHHRESMAKRDLPG